MIPDLTKTALKRNWGARAEALECFAEVKFIDPLCPHWACYVYALNPNNEDEMLCIFQSKNTAKLGSWKLSELKSSPNETGEIPFLDHEYRPMKAGFLYKKLLGEG